MAIGPNIKQKAENIRLKKKGREVRESLAAGLESMSEDVVSTVARQGDVEGQFQEVIDNTTGKDVISAPELIAARNGESNLKARLDKEQQEVAAQLEQTDLKINQTNVWVEEKANTSYVNQLISRLSENGPYDAVVTVSALYDKYPDGAPGPILVFENNHSYIWANNNWEDFGVYQGVEVADSSIGKNKMKTSVGSLQDAVYLATGYVMTRVDTNLKVRFTQSNRIMYRNIDGFYDLSFASSEYIIPTNYGLFFNTSTKEFVVKDLSNITINDILLIFNYDGIDAINNIKELNSMFNDSIGCSGNVFYSKKSNNDILVKFDLSKARLRFRTGNKKDRYIDVSKETYTVPSSSVLVFNDYEGTLVVREWSFLKPDDVILLVNYEGNIHSNNVNATQGGFGDIIYFRDTVVAESLRDNSFNIHFSQETPTSRIYYRRQGVDSFIALSNYKFNIKTNEMLAIDVIANKLVVAEPLLSNGNLVPLVTNHNGNLKDAHIKIENASMNLGFVVNGNENTEEVWNKAVSQGITIIDDYLIVFIGSSEDHSEFQDLFVYDKNTMDQIKKLKHNFGHVNSCDYNKRNDKLIFGKEVGAEVYIINNFGEWIKNAESGSQIDFNTTSKVAIDLTNNQGELGSYPENSRQANPCWGESDNLIYINLNSNGAVYRCFLGMGLNDLTIKNDSYGEFIDVSENEYNGTLRVLDVYYNSNYLGVNQDIAYYEGKLYCASSFDRALAIVYDLISNKGMRMVDSYNHDMYSNMGDRINAEPEGVAISDGKIYQGFKTTIDGAVKSGYIITPV